MRQSLAESISPPVTQQPQQQSVATVSGVTSSTRNNHPSVIMSSQSQQSQSQSQHSLSTNIGNERNNTLRLSDEDDEMSLALAMSLGQTTEVRNPTSTSTTTSVATRTNISANNSSNDLLTRINLALSTPPGSQKNSPKK